jgi:hypothetical protein
MLPPLKRPPLLQWKGGLIGGDLSVEGDDLLVFYLISSFDVLFVCLMVFNANFNNISVLPQL